MDLRDTLVRAIRDVEGLKRSWALIGGLAVSTRAEPRLTRDVDIALAVEDDSEAEQAVRELVAGGYEMVAALEQEKAGRLASARLRPVRGPERGALVDLLFASSGIEREVAERAERLEVLPGVVVPVATIADPIALKVLARDDRNRPLDYDDLVSLSARATPEDLDQTRAALRLITERGYERDRDLLALLCTYAHPGTPWLEELVDEAVRQIRSLEDRDVGAYAFARRHLLPLMRELDRCRDPVALPHFLVCHDPVALLRNNPERWR